MRDEHEQQHDQHQDHTAMSGYHMYHEHHEMAMTHDDHDAYGYDRYGPPLLVVFGVDGAHYYHYATNGYDFPLHLAIPR